MARIKFLLLTTVFTAISIVMIYLLYLNVHPGGGIYANLDSRDIEQRSVAFLDEHDLKYDDLSPVTQMQADEYLIRQMQEKSGLSKSNELLRDAVPGYYWTLEWRRATTSVVFGNGSKSLPEKTLYSFKYDTKGNLLEFNMHIQDSLNLVQLNRDEALKTADNFVKKYAFLIDLREDSVRHKNYKGENEEVSISFGNSKEYEYKNERKTALENRTDYQFNYSALDKSSGDTVQVGVKVSGNQVSEYKKEYIFFRDKYAAESNGIYEAVSKIIFYIIIIITIIIIGLKRIRAFEIGFRTAIIMGIIVALCFALEIYLTLQQVTGWEIFIPLILGPLFYAGALVVVWAVGETVARESWNEKMISLDLITKGHVLHSRVGKSFLTGISGGTVISAVSLLLLFAGGSFLNLWYTPERETILEPFSSPSPALTIFNHFIYTAIFITSIFFLFLVSALKKRYSTPVILISGAVIWGIVNTKSIDPLYAAIIFEILIGLMLVYIFIKYDLLSVLTALAVFSIIYNNAGLFFQPHPFYIQSGYFLAAVLILIFIVASISLFTKDSITDFQNITPVFVKNITERQRLQRELEIARDVQMSFLPKCDPEFEGLDIASRCHPANEVGGDYYDFVQVNDCKSGIIIGDVSGKGTQAAFYMTLTKGFLKAVSRVSDSPSEVLCQMNELFYQNVERGTFISMIYGIFDVKDKIFRFARGGHNPVILKSSGTGNAEMLNPTGLALGLEKGILFRKKMQELELPLKSGEVYVFYTDGFTEAMNKNKDEFGEERLMNCIEANSELTAQEILGKIFEEVKTFMGKAHQHDDMTMVVVKIK